jgi:CheY-like chemotaxis protein
MGVSDSPSEPAAAPRPVPRDVLVVEDNYIIALDLENMLRELGVEDVRIASSVLGALELIAARPPQLGLIDVNLGADKSFEVAKCLRELGIPIVFTTGYGDTDAFPEPFSATRIMSKPYTIEALRHAISRR